MCQRRRLAREWLRRWALIHATSGLWKPLPQTEDWRFRLSQSEQIIVTRHYAPCSQRQLSALLVLLGHEQPHQPLSSSSAVPWRDKASRKGST